MTTALASADRPASAADSAPSTSIGPRAAFAWRAVGVVVAVKLAVNLLFAGRYGWHRDELYYADAVRHLMLGYVDFPAVTPWLAALSRTVFGWSSLVGLRTVASLAGAGVILVTAAVARDLGGGRRAQLIAAIAVAPLVVGSNAMFQTVSFDQLGWALTIWATVGVLRRGTVHSWAWLGAAAGLAWNTKYTVVVLFAGLALGFVGTKAGRQRLRGQGPAIALAVLAIAALPNLWWQARHGWPSVDFFTSRGEVRDENPPLRFALELILIAGPAALLLWLSGLRALVRDAATRPLGVALVVVAPTCLLLGGKSYYAAPMVTGAFAAGGVAWERAMTRASTDRRGAGRWWIWPAVIAGTAALASPLILPVLPTSTMVDLGLTDMRDDYGAQLGWPEVAATVGAEWQSLPASARAETAIVAGSYGFAGAIERFGGSWDLPSPVSGHLTWRYWAPAPRTLAATRAIVVGLPEAFVARHCAAHRRIATVDNRWGVDNEERGTAIWSCSLPGTIGDLRPELVRHVPG